MPRWIRFQGHTPSGRRYSVPSRMTSSTAQHSIRPITRIRGWAVFGAELWLILIAPLSSSAQSTPDWTELSATYEEFALPLPQPGGKLVLIHTSGSPLQKIPALKDSDGSYFVGFQRRQLHSFEAAHEVEITDIPSSDPSVDLDSMLEVLLQLRATKNETLADELGKAVCKALEISSGAHDDQDSNVNAWCVRSLASRARSYWLSKLLDIATARAEIAERLRAIARRSKAYDGEADRRLLEDIAASDGSAAEPQDREATVLAELWKLESLRRVPGSRADDSLDRVLSQGLRIVPTLASHLNDRHFTHVSPIGPTSLPLPLRIGEVVAVILRAWSCGTVAVGFVEDPAEAARDLEVVATWYDGVRKMDDEADVFLKAANVSGGIRSRDSFGIALRTIVLRFPEQSLRELKELFSDDDNPLRRDLAKELSASSATRDTLLEYFLGLECKTRLHFAVDLLCALELTGKESDPRAVLKVLKELRDIPCTEDHERDFEEVSTIAFLCDDNSVAAEFLELFNGGNRAARLSLSRVCTTSMNERSSIRYTNWARRSVLQDFEHIAADCELAATVAARSADIMNLDSPPSMASTESEWSGFLKRIDLELDKRAKR